MSARMADEDKCLVDYPLLEAKRPPAVCRHQTRATILDTTQAGYREIQKLVSRHSKLRRRATGQHGLQ